MWEMSDPIAEVGRDVCPDPEAVHEPNRFKTGIDIERQKARLKAQSPELPKEEKRKSLAFLNLEMRLMMMLAMVPTMLIILFRLRAVDCIIPKI